MAVCDARPGQGGRRACPGHRLRRLLRRLRVRARCGQRQHPLEGRRRRADLRDPAAHAAEDHRPEPAVADGRVVVASTDGVVHAFASAGGAELWSRRIGRFAYSAAALTGGRAYVGSYDHRLYALDAANGAVLWTRLGPGPVSGAPAAIGRLIWFSTCGSCSSYESNPRARRTFVVDALTGEPVWSFPDGEYSPAVTDGLRVYLTGYTALYGLAPARR